MSSSGVAISVRGLSKSYTISHQQEKHSTLVETLLQRARNPLQRSAHETFWALKDVSFEIKQGDVVGIIGRNGAGKSTLLKILSRITGITEGAIDVYGRISGLLEVGTGFHPELTGRENIYLNGAILGMTRNEIHRQFNAIVNFAEIEKFLDTPVKRYSSGMYVRLAFAIAAHLQPEILILDEVLAVGDHAFQEKCFDKMREVAQGGHTLLFVSHNLTSVAKLCTKGVYLSGGEVAALGSIQEVLDAYLASDTVRAGVAEFPAPADLTETTAYFSKIELLNDKGEVASDIDVRKTYQFRLHFCVVKATANVELSIKIRDLEGRAIFTSNLSEDNTEFLDQKQQGSFVYEVEFPSMFLVPGTYSVDAAVHQAGHLLFDFHSNLMQFSITDTGTQYSKYGDYRALGTVLRRLPWKSGVAV